MDSYIQYEEEINSQEFIETQFDEGPQTYADFCKINFGERVPVASTQNQRTGAGCINPKSENNEDTESEKLVLVEKSILEEMVKTINTLRDNQQKQHNNLLGQINVIKNGQKALMTEFIKIRNNPLNIRHCVDSENTKFLLPFNDVNSFINFDASLLTDEDSAKHLKSIYMKQPALDFKKFMRANLKNIFTDDLAQQFTFNGRQGNMSAKKFNVIKLLKECSSRKFENITEEDFHSCITKYFYYIKDKIARTCKNKTISGPSTPHNIRN